MLGFFPSCIIECTIHIILCYVSLSFLVFFSSFPSFAFFYFFSFLLFYPTSISILFPLLLIFSPSSFYFLPCSFVPILYRYIFLTISILFVLFLSYPSLSSPTYLPQESLYSPPVWKAGYKPCLNQIFVLLRVLNYLYYQVLKALERNKNTNITSFSTLLIRLRESLYESIKCYIN